MKLCFFVTTLTIRRSDRTKLLFASDEKLNAGQELIRIGYSTYLKGSGLEMERACFFRARVELELLKSSPSRARASNFSSSSLVEPSFQAHIFSLLPIPTTLPTPQLEMHPDILILKDLWKFSSLLLSEKSLF